MITYKYNGSKYNKYYLWEDTKYTPYNYTAKGILNRIMSNKIYNTNNIYLKQILSFFESSLIYLMKYVDVLKNFKNYHWKNR